MAAAQGAEEGGGGSGGSNADRLFFSSDLEAKHAATLKGEAQVRVVCLHICICVCVCVCVCGSASKFQNVFMLAQKHRAQF